MSRKTIEAGTTRQFIEKINNNFEELYSNEAQMSESIEELFGEVQENTKKIQNNSEEIENNNIALQNLSNDYIIAEGETNYNVQSQTITGKWYYTKWASGRAECWGNFKNIKLEANSADSSYNIFLPFHMKEVIPFLQKNTWYIENAFTAAIDLTKTKELVLVTLNGQSGHEANYYGDISLYIKGKIV